MKVFLNLVIFDPETIEDSATFDKPATLSAGIQSVYVNGVKTFADGQLTGHRSGRYIGKKKLSLKSVYIQTKDSFES